MHPAPSSSGFRGAPTAQRGVVLYTVVILLLLISLLTIAHVRRSLADQRLAANSKESMLLDHAAERVLRWCEAQAIRSYSNGLKLNLASGTSTTPAANIAANWSSPTTAYEYPDVALSGLAAHGQQCIFEEAPLAPSLAANPEFPTPPAVIKLVVTARVRRDDADIFGGQQHFAQSELRIVQ